MKQTLDRAKQTTDSLAHATGQADQMITDLQSRQLPQKVDDTINSAKSAAAQLDQTSRQLHQTIAEATSPDSSGVTAGANLRDSLANVNSATANLSDDTEALKHEFFFKGFFKKRGYYQLSNMNPAVYRQDKVFTSASNGRAWLVAADLFDSPNGGQEELSIGGKAAVDAAVTQRGDDGMQRGLVVEGYAGTGDAATRIAVSRRRSILVSQYVQKHFQLDPRSIGPIGLSGTAPVGVGHQDFDGVCLVTLKPKH